MVYFVIITISILPLILLILTLILLIIIAVVNPRIGLTEGTMGLALDDYFQLQQDSVWGKGTTFKEAYFGELQKVCASCFQNEARRLSEAGLYLPAETEAAFRSHTFFPKAES